MPPAVAEADAPATRRPATVSEFIVSSGFVTTVFRIVFPAPTVPVEAEDAPPQRPPVPRPSTQWDRAYADCPCARCTAFRDARLRQGGPLVVERPPADALAREDLLRVAPRLSAFEIEAVRDMLEEGLLDGGTTVTCLFGVIAIMRGGTYGRLGLGENPQRPLERWLSCHIRMQMTPRTSPAAATLAAWLDEALELAMEDPPAGPSRRFWFDEARSSAGAVDACVTAQDQRDARCAARSTVPPPDRRRDNRPSFFVSRWE